MSCEVSSAIPNSLAALAEVGDLLIDFGLQCLDNREAYGLWQLADRLNRKRAGAEFDHRDALPIADAKQLGKLRLRQSRRLAHAAQFLSENHSHTQEYTPRGKYVNVGVDAAMAIM